MLAAFSQEDAGTNEILRLSTAVHGRNPSLHPFSSPLLFTPSLHPFCSLESYHMIDCWVGVETSQQAHRSSHQSAILIVIHQIHQLSSTTTTTIRRDRLHKNSRLWTLHPSRSILCRLSVAFVESSGPEFRKLGFRKLTMTKLEAKFQTIRGRSG